MPRATHTSPKVVASSALKMGVGVTTGFAIGLAAYLFGTIPSTQAQGANDPYIMCVDRCKPALEACFKTSDVKTCYGSYGSCLGDCGDLASGIIPPSQVAAPTPNVPDEVLTESECHAGCDDRYQACLKIQFREMSVLESQAKCRAQRDVCHQSCTTLTPPPPPVVEQVPTPVVVVPPAPEVWDVRVKPVSSALSFCNGNPDAQFEGSISIKNGPADVKYRWERSDGGTTAIQTLHFSDDAPQSVSYGPWTLTSDGIVWVKLHIYAPTEILTNAVTIFVSDCPAVTPTPVPNINVAGYWSTPQGVLTLEQEGDQVTGNYTYQYVSYQPTDGVLPVLTGWMPFEGTVEGANVHAFTKQCWGSSNNCMQIPLGTLTFDMQKNTFNGFGGWCGAKDGGVLPEGCGFSLTNWRVDGSITCANPVLTLKQQMGDQVSGTICQRPFQGSVTAASGVYYHLTGFIDNKADTQHSLNFYRMPQDNPDYAITTNQMRGSFVISNPLCAAKEGEPMPDPCIY